MNGHEGARSILVFLLFLVGALASAQQGPLREAERLYCNGDNIGATALLDLLLKNPALGKEERFDAVLLLAEIDYQGDAVERFLALTDSAALWLDPHENEAWARIETNRCRYAHYNMIPARAVDLGEAALARYHKARDKRSWKHAYLIHQSLAAAYRNHEKAAVDGRVFQHFDTAVALANARADVLPYWKSIIWRSLSNAAMDRMRPGSPERAKYGAQCRKAQLMAMELMDGNHPENRSGRAHLYNLHGLYQIYADHPDSALLWFRQARELIRADVFDRQDLLYIASWLSSLRWQAMVFEQEPWRSDTVELRRYLDELVAAEPLFTRYADAEATAAGLFTHDKYFTAPYTAIVSTCYRLWELTGQERYVQQVLRSTEGVRRDAWNTAQRIRDRPELQLGPAPMDMLAAIRERLADDQGTLVLVDHDLAGVSQRAYGLAITVRDMAFWSDRPGSWYSTWESIMHPGTASDRKALRRALHDLYMSTYQLAAHVLDSRIERIGVLGSGIFSTLPFDAFLADTLSANIAKCHPLVERFAVSHPFFLLPPIKPATQLTTANYLAPDHGTGARTDLGNLRSAMVRWGKGTLPGAVDSSLTDAQALLARIDGTDLLVLGGHCGGQLFQHDQPRHIWGSCPNDTECGLLPSEVLALAQAPALTIHAACHGGAFYSDGSTGSVSFARAFLFAGGQHVVAALDAADEGSAVRLLDGFLGELAQDVPPDLALQRAKLAYLASAQTDEEALPVHWAVWQLWSAVEEQPREVRNTSWAELGLGLLLLFGIGGIFWARTGGPSRRKVAPEK